MESHRKGGSDDLTREIPSMKLGRDLGVTQTALRRRNKSLVSPRRLAEPASAKRAVSYRKHPVLLSVREGSRAPARERLFADAAWVAQGPRSSHTDARLREVALRCVACGLPRPTWVRLPCHTPHTSRPRRRTQAWVLPAKDRRACKDDCGSLLQR